MLRIMYKRKMFESKNHLLRTCIKQRGRPTKDGAQGGGVHMKTRVETKKRLKKIRSTYIYGILLRERSRWCFRLLVSLRGETEGLGV